MNMGPTYFLIAIIIGVAVGQTTPSVKDILSHLPSEYQGQVNETQIEDIKNQTTEKLKEKCEQNGGLAAFENAKKSFTDLPQCLMTSLDIKDFEAVRKEIEDAKPNGAVDEVFKKYCAKTPAAMKCMRNATDALRPCLAVNEREGLAVTVNVSNQLAEFICYKEGDRIALFIAEGGLECYEEHTEELQNCANSTLGADYNIGQDLTSNALPELTFGEKQCKQLNELQGCVVKVLEQCRTPTTANIINSLFTFIRKATPCADVVVESTEKTVITPKARSQINETKPNAATGLAVTSATIIMSLATLVL